MNYETLHRSLDWLFRTTDAFYSYRKTFLAKTTSEAHKTLRESVERDYPNSSFAAYSVAVFFFFCLVGILVGISFLYWLGFALLGLSIPFGHIFAVVLAGSIINDVKTYYIGWREYNRKLTNINLQYDPMKIDHGTIDVDVSNVTEENIQAKLEELQSFLKEKHNKDDNHNNINNN